MGPFSAHWGQNCVRRFNLRASFTIAVILLTALAGTARASSPVLLPQLRSESSAWDYDAVLDSERVLVSPDAPRVLVHDSVSLEQALAGAAPGQVIEVADGVYDSGAAFRVHGVRATKEAPLIIRAQNRGGAVISGDSWFLVEESSYVVIDGFTFTTDDDTNSYGVRLQSTDHSRVTRNHFALKESPGVFSSRHWVYIAGTGADFNRIDHNLFEKKRRIGNFISINGDDVQVAQYTRVDRNHFRDVRSVNHNGMESIRIGWSGLARSHAFAVIEHNLFEQCSGEAEIITVKSAGNHIRYNTFWESEGAVTFRHGNDNRAYGNYFLGNNKPGTGGIRVYGRGHLVYNNHFEGLDGTGSVAALSIGAADVGYQEAVHNYWRVDRLLVAFNTFVNNRSSIEIAWGWGPDRAFTPVSTVIANNLVVSEKAGALVSVGRPSDITWIGNVMHTSGRARIGFTEKAEGMRVADPGLIASVAGVHYVGEGSPVVDAALRLSIFEMVDVDIEGKVRDARPDVGAYEYAQELPLLRGPLTPAEVGPDAGNAVAFSLEVPRVYVTKMHLDGEFDERRGGWWGPLSVTIDQVATGGVSPAATLTLLVDGDEVYQGEAEFPSKLTLNQGELQDGRHTLTAIVATQSHRDERSLRFQVSNLKIESPASDLYVQGDFPVDVAVGFPPDRLRSIRITLDDELILEGPELPQGIIIDSTELGEGAHRLQATATSTEGAIAWSERNVTVDNYWELSDALQPPVDWGLLGVMDRSHTSSKSNGWLYETEEPSDFYDDADRMTPGSDRSEHLVWETPKLTEAVITLYATSQEVTGGLILSVSRDGAVWDEIDHRVRSVEQESGRWHKLVLAAILPEEVGALSHFRLELNGSRLSEDEGLQVGHMELRGLH